MGWSYEEGTGQADSGSQQAVPPVVEQANQPWSYEEGTEDSRPGQTTAVGYGVIHGVPGGSYVAPIGGVVGSYLDPHNFPFTGSLADRYSQAKSTIEQRGEEAAAAHPVTAGVAELGAGIATIPGAPTEWAASKIPSSVLFAPVLRGVSRLGTSAAYNAGLGAAGAYEGGGDPGKGALYGAGFGTAGEMAGYGVRKLSQYAPVTDAAREYEATRRISESMQGGTPAMSQAEFNAAAASGAPVALGDLGAENTRALARAIANKYPGQAGALTNFVADRYQKQAGRFGGFFDSLFPGQPLDSAIMQDQNKMAARAANDPAYKAAFNHPNAGAIWSPKLSGLMQSERFQNAVRGAQKDASDEAARQGVTMPQMPFVINNRTGQWVPRRDAQGNAVGLPNLQFWDATKRNLDSQINIANRAGDNNLVRQLTGLKGDLTDELDRATTVAGPQGQRSLYKDARATAGQFLGERDAITAASKFAGLGRNEPAYSQMVQDIGGMSSGEREMFARAYAAQLKQGVLASGDSRNALNQFNSTIGAEKAKLALNTVNDPNRAGKLEAFLRTESAMDKLRGAFGNSTTMGQASQAHLASPGGGGGGHDHGGVFGNIFGPTVGAGATAGVAAHEMGYGPGVVAGAAGGGMLVALMQRAASGYNKDVVGRVAQKLASNNPNDVNQAVNFVAREPKLMDALRRAEASISFAAGQRMQ